MRKRFIIIVLDSLGVGALPDAADFGDDTANTLGHISENSALSLPNLQKMGIGNIVPLNNIPPAEKPLAAWGKMASQAKGMDTTSGHWEMCGIVLAAPMPTFPNGFPQEIIDSFSAQTGRGVLGNCVASGTAIIEQYGAEHMATGKLIVYTSADSVFQIAAHEQIVPPEQLYEICKIARGILVGQYGVGRVIARPFIGNPGAFSRTENRRDFSLVPPERCLLAKIAQAGYPVISVGKISDIFAGKNISMALPGHNNKQSIDSIKQGLTEIDQGLIFANLVDFDAVFGHRNDVQGYAKALMFFDDNLPDILSLLREDDILVITADHGNDPCTPGTDHNREYVPLIVTGKHVMPGFLGVRETFADLGQTVAEYFGAQTISIGKSFLGQLLGKEGD